MLHSLFGSNRSFVSSLLLLPIILFVVLAGLNLEVPSTDLGGPLFDWLISFLGGSKWVLLICGMIVNMASALVLNIVSNAHNFNRRENFYPAITFILIGSLDLTWWYLNPVSIGILFFLLALRRLLRIYRVQEVTGKVFDAGFLLAMAALFFPPMVIAFPLIWMSLVQLRSFNFREWLVPVTGFLVPAIFVGVIYFYHGYTFEPSEYYAFSEDGLNTNSENQGGGYLAFLLFTLAISVVGAYIFITDMQVSTVHKKNAKKVMVWSSLFLILTSIYCLFLADNAQHLVVLAAVPISIALGDFFLSTKRKMVIIGLFYAWILTAFIYPLLATIF